MQTASDSPGSQITQLTAINIAKVVTIACLLGMAIAYGTTGIRPVLYLCLHVSYCVWWLLEQWLFPQRSQHIFTDKIGIVQTGLAIAYVGVFYALPGYFAFTNPEPITHLTIAIALVLYIFGSQINTGADIQKMTAKTMGAGLVQDGIWRSVRNVNYLGDLLRYLSFSILAGSLWAYLVPLSIFLFYLNLMAKKEEAMAAKYPDFAEYRDRSTRLLPRIW